MNELDDCIFTYNRPVYDLGDASADINQMHVEWLAMITADPSGERMISKQEV